MSAPYADWARQIKSRNRRFLIVGVPPYGRGKIGDNKPHHGEKRSFSTLFFKRLQINYCFELLVVYACALMCQPLYILL
jgi:hypothetical protein